MNGRMCQKKVENYETMMLICMLFLNVNIYVHDLDNFTKALS